MKTLITKLVHLTVVVSLLVVCSALVPCSDAANRTWDGGGADSFWQTAGNWDGNTPPSANDTLVFTGTTRLNNTNNYTAGTVFNGLDFAGPAGAFTLRGSLITLAGDITNSQTLVTETINLPLALDATRNIGVVTDGLLTIGGVVSGTGGFIKNGGGLLTLSATNHFSGPVTVLEGAVSVASDANLGTVPGVATPGSIVLNGGALRTTSSFSLNANRGLKVGPAAGAGEGTIEVNSGGTLAYDGVVANDGSGTGGLTKLGFGGLTLSRANTYTGPTVVKNGSITLDFTKTASASDNIISPSSSLIFGGANAGLGTASYAALNMNAKPGNTNSQAFSDTTVNIGPAILRATNGTANLSLGALTHAPSGTLVIVTNSTGAGGRITTTTSNTHGVLGGWATIGTGGIFNNITMGTDLASVDASGSIVPYSAYTLYGTGQMLHNNVNAGTNLRINGSSTGDVVVNTDGAGTTTDVNVINLSETRAFSLVVGSNNTLRLGRFGSIFKSDNANNITWALGTGTTGGGNGAQNAGILTAGGAPDTPGEIVFYMNNGSSQSQGSLNVEARVTDNGSGSVALIKAGPASMKLRGNNTHSGGLYLLQGRLQLAGSEIGAANPDGAGTGPIYVFPSAYIFPSGAGAFGTTGVAISNNFFIAGNGTQQEPVGAIRFGNGVRIAGDVTLIGDARLGGGNDANRAITGISGKISGPFSLDLGAIQTINSYFALFNPANDWSGTTTFNARNTATINNILNGASEVIPNGFGKGNVVMNGNTSTGTINWDLNGFNETINGLWTTANNPSGCIILNRAAGTNSTLTLGDYGQSATFAGAIIADAGLISLIKIGGGAQTLSGINTYTGDTTINGGTLELVGAGSIANSANIFVNAGGTLDVAGTSDGFNSAGPVSVNGGTLVVRNSGAGSIASLNLNNGHLRLSTLGGTNVVATSLIFDGPTNLIDVTSVGFITSYPAQFTVIKYTGAFSGSFNVGLGAVPSSTTVGYVSNNAANSSVDLVLLDGPKPLTWTGSRGSDWDVGITTNWLAFGTTPVGFVDADSAIFQDGASTGLVNLTGLLRPGTTVVSNQTLAYILTGPGYLSGFGNLVKDGSGTLTLANKGASDFKGGVTINGGLLAFGTDNAISGGTTIGFGATAQVGTNGPSGTLPSGTVVNDGELVLNRSDDFSMVSPLTGSGVVRKLNTNAATLGAISADYFGQILVAQGTVKAGGGLGGAGATTIVSNAATLDVNGQNLTATTVRVRGSGVGGNGAIVNSGADQINALGNVILEANATFGGTGRWDIRGGLAMLSTEFNPFNLTKTGSNQFSLVGVTVDPMLGNINVQQGTLSVETSTGELGDVTKPLTVSSGASLQLYGTTYAYSKPIMLNGDGATPTLNIANGTANLLIGNLTLTGPCIIGVGGGFALTLSGTVSGSGSLIKSGAGTNILAGAITYSGPTTVSNGTLLVNSPKGPAGGMSVQSGGILGGWSTIAEPVLIGVNGVLSPGDASLPVSSLTIDNSLTLSGLVQMDVLKAGGQIQNDVITNITTLTLGGRLQLNVDTNSEALALNDTLKLFSFNSVNGQFAEIIPATPGPGLFWDQSQLPVNGTLKVTSAPPAAPDIEAIAVSGSDLIFSGGGGVGGGSFVVLSTTNLVLPLASWERELTNAFLPNGGFSVTNSIQTGVPQKFYILLLQ